MVPAVLDLRPCIVCGIMLNQEIGHNFDRDIDFYDCPHCGKFGSTMEAREDYLIRDFSKSPNAHLLSYFIRRKQNPKNTPILDTAQINLILTTGKLPTPKEQSEHLIRWVGENSIEPGAYVAVGFDHHGAIIGAKSSNGFLFIVKGLMDEGLLVARDFSIGTAYATLTFNGWERFQELKRGVASGRKAFMAMPFGKGDVREMYHHFRVAAARTGFTLETLDEQPKAGLIDDRIRVEIQNAKFLVADLTYDNNGAYWEAGYAEGLGKPVIYTCNQVEFDKKGTHFDTNHHITVKWDLSNAQKAMAALVATIRATLPDAVNE